MQADAGGIMFHAMNKLLLVGMQLTENLRRIQQNILVVFAAVFCIFVLIYSVM